MSHRGVLSRRRPALAVPIAVGLVSIGSLFTVNAAPASATTRTAQAASFKVCMGTGGQTGLSWTTGQGQVLQSLAKKEGWQSVTLSNNNSASTALANIRTFVLDKCNAIVEFNGQPSANPVMEKLTSAAHIPTITYDIGQPGWYFVGIDNLRAGIAGGQMLGKIVKQRWGCDADALIASEKARGRDRQHLPHRRHGDWRARYLPEPQEQGVPVHRQRADLHCVASGPSPHLGPPVVEEDGGRRAERQWRGRHASSGRATRAGPGHPGMGTGRQPHHGN